VAVSPVAARTIMLVVVVVVVVVVDGARSSDEEEMSVRAHRRVPVQMTPMPMEQEFARLAHRATP
jgi:hypothetical protein